MQLCRPVANVLFTPMSQPCRPTHDYVAVRGQTHLGVESRTSVFTARTNIVDLDGVYGFAQRHTRWQHDSTVICARSKSTRRRIQITQTAQVRCDNSNNNVIAMSVFREGQGGGGGGGGG